MGKVVFFEVFPWEVELLRSRFPDAPQVEEKLTQENVHNYADAEVVCCFIYSKIDQAVIDSLPNLKLIATRSTGFDHIDIGYAKQKGITVVNVPEYGSTTVAEHTFGLIVNLTRKIYQAINQVKDMDFSHTDLQGIDLEGKVLGIIGLGKIGRHVLRIAKGFGMEVIAYSHAVHPGVNEADFRYVSFEDLLRQSDVVTLHVPLTPETKYLINKENIRWFKKGSYLINTARGGLVETEAILIGLNEEILAGVGLDVLEGEHELSEEVALLVNNDGSIDFKSLLYDHILIDHPKVLITPHNAFNSLEAMQRIVHTTLESIEKFANGEVINAV